VAFTEINEPGVSCGADVAGDGGAALAVAGLVAIAVAVLVTEPGLVVAGAAVGELDELVVAGAAVGELDELARVVAARPAEVLATE
jgi:hypothetical protein